MSGSGAALERGRALYARRDYPGLAELAAGEPGIALEAEPELGFMVADAWRRLGRADEALALVRRLAPLCAARGNDRLFRDRLNVEGILLFGRGDVAAAESVWRDLLEAASRGDDEEFVARANNNLGVICTLRGRREEALASYERAIAAYHRRGYLRGLAQAHQNLAITYRDMGFGDEADTHFRRTIAYARADGSEDEIARAEQERALLIYSFRRDGRLAEATAKQALRRFRRLRDVAGIADATRVLAIIHMGERRNLEAGKELDEAIRLARSARAPLLIAESLEAQAALALLEGRDAEAASLQEEAARGFGELGAAAWGERTRRRLADLTWRAAAEEAGGASQAG